VLRVTACGVTCYCLRCYVLLPVVLRVTACGVTCYCLWCYVLLPVVLRVAACGVTCYCLRCYVLLPAVLRVTVCGVITIRIVKRWIVVSRCDHSFTILPRALNTDVLHTSRVASYTERRRPSVSWLSCWLLLSAANTASFSCPVHKSFLQNAILGRNRSILNEMEI